MTKRLRLGVAFREAAIAAARALGYQRVIPIARLREGWSLLELEVVAIASELLAGEQRGVPLSTTVRDWVNAPHVAKVHQAFEDILTLTLDEPLRTWAERLLRHPPVKLLESLHARMEAAMCDASTSPVLRVLAKFYVFQCLRVGLYLVDHRTGEQNMAAAGLGGADLDRAAEAALMTALERSHPQGKRVLMFESMFVHAAMHIEGRMQREIASLSKDLLDTYAGNARIEARLRSMDAKESVLARARFEGHGEIENPAWVARKHAVVLGEITPEALSVRTTRLLADMEVTRKVPTRTGKALVDMFQAMEIDE